MIGVEYGAGFGVRHDARQPEQRRLRPAAGGRIGTTTEPPRRHARRHLVGHADRLALAIKPTSSLPRQQRTVTRSGEPTEIATKGRHDPCLLPRFVPMGEAMVAIMLADHALRQPGSR